MSDLNGYTWKSYEVDLDESLLSISVKVNSRFESSFCRPNFKKITLTFCHFLTRNRFLKMDFRIIISLLPVNDRGHFRSEVQLLFCSMTGPMGKSVFRNVFRVKKQQKSTYNLLKKGLQTFININ